MGDSGARRRGSDPRTPASDGASWTITRGAGTGTIVLRFVGPTRTEEIPAFIAALTQMMPPRDAHIIFDLRELSGHNLGTRAPIKRWLGEHKSRIEQLTVLVNQAATIIKMAVSVVGMATGIKIRMRDDVHNDASLLELKGPGAT
jgi:hypothetical protein